MGGGSLDVRADIGSDGAPAGLEHTGKRRWLRRLFLGLLALACVATEAGLIYYLAFFSSPVFPRSTATQAAWRNGNLVVTRIINPERAVGVKKGDRIVGVIVGGRRLPIDFPGDMAAVAREVPFNQPFQLLVLRPDGAGNMRELALTIPAVPPSVRPSTLRRLLGVAPDIFIFLACLLAALLIGMTRPESEGAIAASLLFLCFGALTWHGNMEIFPSPARAPAYALWFLLYAGMTAALMWFCLRFPSPSPIDRRLPWLKRAGVYFAVIFGVWNGVLWAVRRAGAPIYDQYLGNVRYLDWVLDIVFVLIAAVGLAALILNMRRSESPDERRRLRILLVGVLSVFPWLLASLYQVTVLRLPPEWIMIVVTAAMLLFPLSFIYAVLRHRVFGIRVILRRGIQFALLSRGFLALEGLAIFLALYYAAGPPIARIAGKDHGGVMAIVVAGLTLVGVVGLRKINGKVMVPVEKRFFREAYDVRRILTGLTVDLRRLVGTPDALVWSVVNTLADTLHPRDVSVFLQTGALAALPLTDERGQALLSAISQLPAGSFVCFWRRRFGVPAPQETASPGSLSLVLPAGSIAADLLAAPGEEGQMVSLDPKDRQSSARLFRQKAPPAEKTVLIETTQARLLVPLAPGKEILGFLVFGEKLSEEPYSREDRELLRALAAQMADTLDHARLLHESEKQAQLMREVEIAQQVQRHLLPATPLAVPGLDYAGVCRPARYVGGDYFDFIRFGDRGLGLVLGDISGKGISAALLMAALQATVREQADARGGEPSAVIAGVNRRLFTSAGEGRFATVFYGMLDTRTFDLKYANAGHNPPIVFRPGPDGGRFLRLGTTGVVAGVFQDAGYEQASIQLMSGDLLVLFSDGVTDAMNENDECFEEERLLALLPTLLDLPASEALARILDEVGRFAGRAPQNDDITLIVAKVL
ncbi:MAG: SpoIIE family protein phosphatase [Acidobacteriota bacterium]